MIRIIRRLFGLCDHSYASWEVFKQLTSSYYGGIKIFQSRKCQKCGYVQVNVKELY